jgi:hypothetical protein
MRIKRFTLLIFSGMIIISALITGNIFSYPRFSAYSGEKCGSCHINPTGGTMRNEFGLNFAKQNLQMNLFQKLSADKKYSSKITKFLSVGGDVRIVHIDNEIAGLTKMNTFLTMQGDLYVNAEVNDNINVFVSPGIQIPNIPTKYEVYGMISKLPMDLYFKAGRFTPNFGIRIPEHRAFQRQGLLNTPYAADAGFEFGTTISDFNFNFGLFNGLNTDFFDADQSKMFIATGDYIFSSDKIVFNLGTSFYNNPYNYLDPNSSLKYNANKKAMSGFTKVGLFKKFALLGEVDFAETNINGDMVRALYGYSELNCFIARGVELRAQIEFRDPNRDAGGDLTRRYSFGVALFPLLGFETEAMMRYSFDDRIKNTSEWQWNFHFYF